MTVKQFQEKYHDYTTTNEMEARVEALKLKVVNEDGTPNPVHAVKLGDLWCLMVASAANTLDELGII